MINVAIIEDNKKYVECLQNSINAFADCKVVHCLYNALHIEENFISETPDVAIVDINMPGISGLEAVKLISEKFPHTRCIMLTQFEDVELLKKSYVNGAMGYLIKGKDSIVKIVESIRLVHSLGQKNEFPLNAGLVKQMLDLELDRSKNFDQKIEKFKLTERQCEILKLLMQGLSYKEIAEKLSISIDTLNSHVKAIYPKIGVKSRAELGKIL